MCIRSIAAAVAFGLAAVQPLHADDISDALQSAMEAYEEGDINYALEELEYAKQLMVALNADALVQFLPAAPDGWTREVNTEMNAGLAMMAAAPGPRRSIKAPGTA